MLPADQVEALEGLVDEVEGVSRVGEGAISVSFEQETGEVGRRGSACDSREHGALGRFAMAYCRPTPQPALDNSKIGLAREWRTLLARRLSLAVGCYAAGAVDQGETDLFLLQHG